MFLQDSSPEAITPQTADFDTCHESFRVWLLRQCRILVIPLLVFLTSCTGIGDPPNPPGWSSNSPLTGPGSLKNAPAPLITPTYDGSGQTVEPTVLYFPNQWRGHRYWMAVSPYANSDPLLENPSILVSEDGQSWEVPAGAVNPIELARDGTLADATLFYDQVSDQLWVYYLNDVILAGRPTEFLLRTTSSDGIHWSDPLTLISGPLTYVDSPSVSKVGSTYILWVVNTEVGLCSAQTSTVEVRTSLDGVNWSPSTVLNINQPGYVIWHVNTIPVPSKGQFMSLLAAYPLGKDCGETKLFFANSHDGLNWQTYPNILLDTSKSWDDLEIYRSSLLYDPETALLRVWYSAYGQVPHQWHVGYTQEVFPIQ